MYQLPKNELHEAYWVYTHRFLLKKMGYALAITITSVIWIVFIFSFVIYVTGISSARRAQETLLDSQVLYRNRVVAQPLQVVTADTVASSATTFDAYVLVKNPNKFYSADFHYSINLDGKVISFTDGRIMPQTEAYYVASAIAGTTLPKVTNGIIDQTIWNRLKNAPFSQPDFTITNPLLEAVKVATSTISSKNNNSASPLSVNTTTVNTSPKSVVNTPTSNATDTSSYPYSKLSATFKNEAIIGFNTVRAVAVIKQNATILGIKELTLHDIASYSETPLEFYWQRRFIANSTNEIFIYTDYITRDNLVYPGE